MHYKSPKVRNFCKQLALIKEKTQEFDLATHAQTAAKAKELYQHLQNTFNLYLNGEMGIETFRKNCSEVIDLARPEFEQYQEWDLIFANLSFLIVLMGMGSTVTRIVNLRLSEDVKTDRPLHQFNWIQTSLQIN